MCLSNQAEMGYPYGSLNALNGELYGTIKIELPLFDDSETSQIVRESVSQVLLKFNQESDVVYEAILIKVRVFFLVLLKFNQESDVVYEAILIKNAMSKDQSDDYVCVKLSAQCVQEQNLMPFVNFSGSNAEAQEDVPVVIQFQLDRINFVYQHHAVDNLRCMTVLFPPYPQGNRFEYVHKSDVENREDEMNIEQEKAARYICNAGGLRGNSYFRGKGPVIIFGPFGTGKTYTIANSVKRMMILRNDSRILICSSRGSQISHTGGHHGSSSSSSSSSSHSTVLIFLLSLSPVCIILLIAVVFCCCKAGDNPKEKLALAIEKKEQELSRLSGILTGCNAQGKSAPVKKDSAVQTESDRGPTKVATQSASTESLPPSYETVMGTVDGQKK
eukprot:XP_011661707.1 PREDICTED: probable helicase with zinc finger domain [Strongylocentrotus purpuratus]